MNELPETPLNADPPPPPPPDTSTDQDKIPGSRGADKKIKPQKED